MRYTGRVRWLGGEKHWEAFEDLGGEEVLRWTRTPPPAPIEEREDYN